MVVRPAAHTAAAQIWVCLLLYLLKYELSDITLWLPP